MEQKDIENQHTKGFWERLKDAWGILLPIYKDVLHHDPKRFIKSIITRAGIGILWGVRLG